MCVRREDVSNADAERFHALCHEVSGPLALFLHHLYDQLREGVELCWSESGPPDEAPPPQPTIDVTMPSGASLN